jgi:hypothetical protein
MFSLLAENNENSEEFIKNTKKNLDDFSNDGLRTLVVAYRKLDDNYFRDWLKKWNNTENEMVLATQQELRKQLSMEIEKEMILLGGTALEDKVINIFKIFLYFLKFFYIFLFFYFIFLYFFSYKTDFQRLFLLLEEWV